MLKKFVFTLDIVFYNMAPKRDTRYGRMFEEQAIHVQK